MNMIFLLRQVRLIVYLFFFGKKNRHPWDLLEIYLMGPYNAGPISALFLREALIKAILKREYHVFEKLYFSKFSMYPFLTFPLTHFLTSIPIKSGNMIIFSQNLPFFCLYCKVRTAPNWTNLFQLEKYTRRKIG